MSDLIAERDEKGRITKSGLTPEKAREIGRLGNEATHGRPVKLGELLASFGYDDNNQAPPHIQILAAAAIKSSNPVTALRELMTQVATPGAANQTRPEIGSLCPTCAQYVGELDGETLLLLLGILEAGGLEEWWKASRTPASGPPPQATRGSSNRRR